MGSNPISSATTGKDSRGAVRVGRRRARSWDLKGFSGHVLVKAGENPGLRNFYCDDNKNVLDRIPPSPPVVFSLYSQHFIKWETKGFELYMDIPTEYCELLADHFLSQPLNAISNVAFLIAAWFAYSYLQNRGIKNLYILPVLLGVVGISSAWWHITDSHIGDLLDTFSIVIFASVAAIFLLTRITKSKLVIAASFVALLAIAFITERLNILNGSLPYVVLLLGLAIAGPIYAKKFPPAKVWLHGSVVTFLLAIVVRSIDILLCSVVPFGTHFLWHILVAALGYQLIGLLAQSYIEDINESKRL